MFMKADMTRNINTVRCNVKTSITKMRGTISKKHIWRNENPIYDYYMDAERKTKTPKGTQKMIIRRPLK